MDEFNEILSVEGLSLSQKTAFPKRLSRIEEAISWGKGTPEKLQYQTVWKKGDYSVTLGKPGKEATPVYKGEQNPEDMKPTIFFKGQSLDKFATFQKIVEDLEAIGETQQYTLELLGALIFRSAFLLDHTKVIENGKEVYRYLPDKRVIEKINQLTPMMYEIPTEAFLYYLDAIAWNEDVKYHLKGHNLQTKSTGGRNNLLTYVNLIAVILRKQSLYALAGPLLRRGVTPISQTKAFECFPHISKNN